MRKEHMRILKDVKSLAADELDSCWIEVLESEKFLVKLYRPLLRLGIKATQNNCAKETKERFNFIYDSLQAVGIKDSAWFFYMINLMGEGIDTSEKLEKIIFESDIFKNKRMFPDLQTNTLIECEILKLLCKYYDRREEIMAIFYLGKKKIIEFELFVNMIIMAIEKYLAEDKSLDNIKRIFVTEHISDEEIKKRLRFLIEICKYDITEEEIEKSNYEIETLKIYKARKDFEVFLTDFPYEKGSRKKCTSDKLSELMNFRLQMSVSGMPGYYCEWNYTIGAFFIKWIYFNEIFIRKSSDYSFKENIKFEFCIKKDMILVRMGRRQKYLPATFKKLAEFVAIAKENRCEDEIIIFCETLSCFYAQNGIYHIKDAMPYIRNGIFLPGLSLAKAINYKSLAEACSTMYPGRKAWNKTDLNILYAVNKSVKYINQGSV